MYALGAVRDLDRLKQLYMAGFHNAFLDSALHKIIDRQIALSRLWWLRS